MNKIKITTALATACLLASSVSPAFAATTVNVSGNGALSTTKVVVKNSQGTKVVQGNISGVTNIVNSTANTGINSSNLNTGGVSSVTTGNATSNVSVNVGGSSNTAVLSPDCGCSTNTTVNVSDNGALSQNKVIVKNSSWLGVLQTNLSEILNVVTGKAKTGGNSSNLNTGDGSVVDTGDATSNVTVNVTGSTNTLIQ